VLGAYGRPKRFWWIRHWWDKSQRFPARDRSDIAAALKDDPTLFGIVTKRYAVDEEGDFTVIDDRDTAAD
jgi:hypothetical protein